MFTKESVLKGMYIDRWGYHGPGFAGRNLFGQFPLRRVIRQNQKKKKKKTAPIKVTLT